MEDNIFLVGFIHQYDENDYSLWRVDLSEEDRIVIDNVLQKYEAEGCSVRGTAALSLDEVV